MSNKLLAGLGVLVVVALVWFFSQGREGTNPTPNPTPQPSAITPQPIEATFLEVVMTDNGYSPQSPSIKKGTTVTFVNSSSKPRWPASAPHPTHTDYPELDPKRAIPVGESWTFTFDRVGAWRYHDHLQTSLNGTITVTE